MTHEHDSSYKETCPKCGKQKKYGWRHQVAKGLLTLGVAYCLCNLSPKVRDADVNVPEPWHAPQLMQIAVTGTATTLATPTGDLPGVTVAHSQIPHLSSYSAVEVSEWQIQMPPYSRSTFERMVKKTDSEIPKVILGGTDGATHGFDIEVV